MVNTQIQIIRGYIQQHLDLWVAILLFILITTFYNTKRKRRNSHSHAVPSTFQEVPEQGETETELQSSSCRGGSRINDANPDGNRHPTQTPPSIEILGPRYEHPTLCHRKEMEMARKKQQEQTTRESERARYKKRMKKIGGETRNNSESKATSTGHHKEMMKRRV